MKTKQSAGANGINNLNERKKMKAKTARRFLARNKWKMVLHETGISKQSKSLIRRRNKCIAILNLHNERTK